MIEIEKIRKLLDEIELKQKTNQKTNEREVIDFLIARLVSIHKSAQSFENRNGKRKSYKAALHVQKTAIQYTINDVDLWLKHGIKPEGIK